MRSNRPRTIRRSSASCWRWAPARSSSTWPRAGCPPWFNGSVYPGIRLPFVEMDQDSVGRIMVRQAIAAGHRRLVFVNREVWRQGDEVAFNGMLDEVHAAGLEQGAIAVRNTPVSPEAVAAAVRHWLDEMETPVALLCRELYFAQVALRAAFERESAGAGGRDGGLRRHVRGWQISCPTAARSAVGRV